MATIQFEVKLAKLSLHQKYYLSEIAKELKLSKRITNGIRNNFGDSVSLHELSQISWGEFVTCRGFGRKSWYEFREAISKVEIPKCAVTLIDKRGLSKIIIEIDISEPFEKVIQELSQIMKSSV
jgi:transposase-like protein